MKTDKIISFWAKALYLSEAGKTKEEWQDTIKRLAEILKKKKKDYLLPEVLKKLERMFLKNKKIELVFARDQGAESRELLKNLLLEKFGKDKEIYIKINQELLGGFRAKTDKLLIKASIKDFLTEIKNHYNNRHG